MLEPTPCPDSDDALMRRSVAAPMGDTGAFACLVRRYQARVIGYAARMLGGDLNAGADIAQEAFVNVWQNRARYNGQGKFASYLLHIAHRSCLDKLRERDGKHGELTETNHPATNANGVELAVCVRESVKSLTPDIRAVFLLHEYEGFTYSEIADALGVPMGTVASRKHAAVQALRDSLAPWLGYNETKGTSK
ncbi:MAG: RNA polymerase sigma factor [Armatimonadetes bacterium]|nr:RNA polymerase sigma factor [Armatimonadota bacterium]